MGWFTSSSEPQQVEDSRNNLNRAPWTIKRFINHNPSSSKSNIPEIPLAQKISSLLSDATKSTDSEDGHSSNSDRPTAAGNHRGRNCQVGTSPRRSPSLQDVQQRLRATKKHAFAIVFSSDEGDSLAREREEEQQIILSSAPHRTPSSRDNSLLDGSKSIKLDPAEMQEENQQHHQTTWNDSPSTIMKSVVSEMFSCASCKCSDDTVVDTTIDMKEGDAVDDIVEAKPDDSKNEICSVGESKRVTSMIDSIQKKMVEEGMSDIQGEKSELSNAAAEKRKKERKKRRRRPLVITTLIDHTLPPQNPPIKGEEPAELNLQSLPTTITIDKRNFQPSRTLDDDQPRVVLVVPDYKGQSQNDINEIRFLTADGATEAIIDREQACRRGYEI